MMTSTPTPRPGPASPRAGFTIVEVLVALLILTVGVLGLAGTTAYVVQATTYGGIQTDRTAAFQSVAERLRSLDYDSVIDGSDSIGRFAMTWTTVSGSQSKLVTIVALGPGLKAQASGPPRLAPSTTDTLELRILR